jgi:hypothetical protein
LQAAVKDFPAPNKYDPYEPHKRKEYPFEKKELKNIDRKRHLEQEKTKKEWEKERNEFWKEKLSEKIETLKEPLPKYPEPLPLKYTTFDKIR